MQMQSISFFGYFYVLTLLGFKIASGIGEDTSYVTDVFFEIIHPPELEYTYKLRPAKDFGVPFNASFLEEKIPLVPAEPPQGCQLAKNAKELKGRVALVERGNCTFFVKSMMVEEAGAKAVIIADYLPTIEESTTNPLWVDYYYIEMTRDITIPPSKTVNIPAGFLLGKNGKMIRQTLKRLNQPFALINIPVNLTYTSLDKVHQPPWLLW
ncbi:PRADC1-like protein isoform X2 [Halictus rubicundus]|uniref:PRADC1-like protein isoform X2 n=1 Tax=Halictus rubicundus TaxID=77578 RepID=UPI004037521F